MGHGKYCHCHWRLGGLRTASTCLRALPARRVLGAQDFLSIPFWQIHGYQRSEHNLGLRSKELSATDEENRRLSNTSPSLALLQIWKLWFKFLPCLEISHVSLGKSLHVYEAGQWQCCPLFQRSCKYILRAELL